VTNSMACTQPASDTQSAVFFAPRAPRAATSRGATSGDGRVAPTRCCGNRHPFLLFRPLACLLRLLCFLGHTRSPDLPKDYNRPALDKIMLGGRATCQSNAGRAGYLSETCKLEWVGPSSRMRTKTRHSNALTACLGQIFFLDARRDEWIDKAAGGCSSPRAARGRALNGARFGFLHLRQRHLEHPVLELSPNLVLIEATRKTEAPGIVADVAFRGTPAGVAWIAQHNRGPSLPGCRSWRHPGYGVEGVMAVQAAIAGDLVVFDRLLSQDDGTSSSDRRAIECPKAGNVRRTRQCARIDRPATVCSGTV
jgi:hypothetical protein